MWVTDDRWILLDTVFRVVSEDVKTAARLRTLLEPFERTSRPARAKNIVQIVNRPEHGLRVYNDCRSLSASDDLDDLLASVMALLNNAAIEDCRRFAIHSAVVGFQDGIVAIPAVSGGGKSTLTGALLKSGFSYLSDEALVVSDDGRVAPYPKPIALSAWSCDALGLNHSNGERLVTPDELGSTVHDRQQPLTDIIVSRQDSSRASLTPGSSSEGVVTLLKHAFNHYKNPTEAFRLATDMARNARTWILDYDDPLEAADLLSRALR